MRHRIGIILAAIMTGMLFFGGAWGYLRLLRFPAPADQLSQLPAGGGSQIPDHHVLLAFAAIAGTGLLAGILIAAPRISPLAAGLPGLLLIGWTSLYLINVRQAVDLIPLRSDPFGAGFEAMLFSGILGAAGLAMIVPMFVPSRWRVRAADESEIGRAEAFGPEQTMPAGTMPAGTMPAGTMPAGTMPAGTAPTPVPTATQLTPTRATTLAPLPADPWHVSTQQVQQTQPGRLAADPPGRP